jgi:tRNA-dihydrouridine synthase B
MMEHFERFGLLLNNRVVRTPVAIASMAGIVDGNYVLSRAAHIGAAFIGGYSIDPPSMEAGRAVVSAGRKEFITDDPAGEIGKQIDLLSKTDVVLGVNMRAAAPEPFLAMADTFGEKIVYEIDAHCRQKPFTEIGCGEALLAHPERLVSIVSALAKKGVSVSVKMRVGVSGDDRAVARKVWRAGAEALHLDLMDEGKTKMRQIRNSCPLTLIANNSINSFDKMKDLLSHGADMVSLARQSDERTLAGLDAAITRYTDEHGWYNSPKQLCRGGDIRALAFCCLPVKNCPLIPTLEKIGMDRQEFIRLKMEYVDGTQLNGGEQTCFGSLAWCCKDTSPCMFRDIAVKQQKMTSREYMIEKRRLSQKLMEKIFS